MPTSLHELVSAALNSATSNIKVASAADAQSTEPAGDDFLDSLLGNSEAKPSTPEAPPAAAKTASASEVLDLAVYAEKVATALDRAAVVVTKLASAGTVFSTPGPVISAAGHDGPSQHPKPVTTAHKYLEAPTPSENTMDNPNGLKTNKDVYTDPDWTKNKEAALRMVRAKIASAEQFQRLGQLDVSAQLLAEAEAIKTAADPSSPQAKLPAHSDSFKIPTELTGHKSQVPDNAAAIALTKAQARNSTTAEAGERLLESPKTDNAVAANLKTTTGLKTSAAEILREKTAVSNKWLAERLAKAHKDTGSLQARLPGAKKIIEKGLEMNEAQGGKKLRNFSVGTMAGAIRDRRKGRLHYLASVPERMRRAAAKVQEHVKTSSLEETQAFLERVAAHARSKTASAEQVEQATALIDYANTYGLEAVHSLINQEQA